jgi:hypothetical protein
MQHWTRDCIRSLDKMERTKPNLLPDHKNWFSQQEMDGWRISRLFSRKIEWQTEIALF